MKRSKIAYVSRIAMLLLCCLLACAVVSAGAEETNFTVATGHPTLRPLYIVEDAALTQELLVNGNVAVTDFASPSCAWKDLGWAGFDGNRLKITWAWEANEGLNGTVIGFSQDLKVEKNTDYTFKFTAMQWNLSGKPSKELKVGFLKTDADGIEYLENTVQTVYVEHGVTQDISLTMHTGDSEDVRLAVTTEYDCPYVTGNFGGYFINNLSFAKSVEKLVNADVKIEDFANESCGWKDLGWAGFDGNRLKLTWAWFADPNLNGNRVAVGQKVAVEKNTDYYLAFDAMQFNVSGRGNHELTVGFALPDTENGIQYLDGQKAVIDEIGDTQTHYVAFNSGEQEEVLLCFETAYEAPVNDNTFGGFFLSKLSLKKIVDAEKPGLDLAPVPAAGSSNYVYIGESGNTVQIDPNILNLSDFGLKAEDVQLTYTANASTEIATVSETGLVTAGIRKGAFPVTVKATSDYNGILIEGSAVIKLRVIYPTDEEVYIDAQEEELPLITDGANVLNNGDFETAVMDTATTDHFQRAEVWRSVIGTWMNTEARAGMDLTVGGKITYRWENGLTEDDTPGFYEDVAVEPYTTYKLSFSLYNWTGVANGHTNLFVGYRNPHGDDIWQSVEEYTIATPDLAMQGKGWSRVTVYLNTGALSEIRVFFYGNAQSGHDGGAGWWFDNIELCKVTDIREGNEAESIEFNVPETVRVGDTIPIQAYDVYAHGFRKESAFVPAVKSSDAAVIAVEDGKLVAAKEGTAEVTFEGECDGKPISQSYQVAVLPVPVSATVKVGRDNTIAEGRDQKIVVTVEFSDGTTETMTKNCTFTVSDATIITQKGNTLYLAGKKAGTATLSVEVDIDGSILNASVDVTVK